MIVFCWSGKDVTAQTVNVEVSELRSQMEREDRLRSITIALSDSLESCVSDNKTLISANKKANVRIKFYKATTFIGLILATIQALKI